MERIKKLPVIKILRNALVDMRESAFSYVVFIAVNFLFSVAGFSIVGGFKEPLFLILVLFYYAFWVYFFRFYFKLKPYFIISDTVSSFVPSVKILFIGAVFILALAFLPFVPLFLDNMSIEQKDEYLQMLQNYMQENKLVDLFLSVLFLFASPVIFYRPFMAWISSITGSGGSMRKAFAKTKGNYWRFVLLGLLLNLPFILWSQLSFYLPYMNIWVIYLPVSIFFVYYNVVIARVYKFFNP